MKHRYFREAYVFHLLLLLCRVDWFLEGGNDGLMFFKHAGMEAFKVSVSLTAAAMLGVILSAAKSGNNPSGGRDELFLVLKVGMQRLRHLPCSRPNLAS